MGAFVEVESVFQGRGWRDGLGECAILEDGGIVPPFGTASVFLGIALFCGVCRFVRGVWSCSCLEGWQVSG